MTAFSRDAAQPAAQFAACRRTLPALGGGNRQHLILKMLQMKDRTGTVTEKVRLSCPAVLISCAY